MFAQMEKAARSWLDGRDPRQIAQRAGAAFDGHAFHLESLGMRIRVSYPDYNITPSLQPWHALVVLHYLHLADGSPQTGIPISFAQYECGLIRGGDFDRRAEGVFRNLDLEILRETCREMGAVEISSPGDYAARIPVFPRFPVTVQFWEADSDFPASGRLLADSSAGHYLTIEDAVTVGEILLNRLQSGKRR